MRKQYGITALLCAALLATTLAGCGGQGGQSAQAGGEDEGATGTGAVAAATEEALGEAAGDLAAEEAVEEPAAEAVPASTAGAASVSTTANAVSGSVLDGSSFFTDRDLEQVADTSDATEITVQNGQDVTISEEGVYVLSGTAQDVTITVDVEDSAKVQLVLSGLSVTNESEPVIYVASADKVFVTTAEGTTNELAVTGDFAFAAAENADGVIFAKDDIVLNGLGTLVVTSSQNGIVGKDDVKVTGGTYQIAAGNHGIQGKDSVVIADGTFAISAGKDGIHAENSDDQSKGYVYIAGGTFAIDASSDGIEGDAVVQVDGGTFSIQAAEGIEGTTVELNGGTIDISARDDGINAAAKSTAYSVLLEINGGDITITMGAGDTDALDANGDLIINGGTVDITAQSAFDFDGRGELNGGTVYVNGEQITVLTNSMMMGGPGMGEMGEMGGQQGGPGGGMGGGPGGGMGGGLGGGMGGGPGGGMR